MLNQVTLIGSLGRDAELRRLPNGMEVLNFSVATYDSYKDKTSGEWKKITDWHNVQIFKPSPSMVDRFKKGVLVFVTGKYKSSTYTKKDGTQTKEYHVLADKAVSLDKNSDTVKQAQERQQESVDGISDDIPF